MIRLERVEKRYQTPAGAVYALAGVDLYIARGEFAAILGHSGSGKSTLMHILGCLDLPTQGTYLLDGEDVCTLSKSRRAAARNEKIGFVFQSFNLLPYCSALENVELPLAFRGINPAARRRTASQALEAVGLADRMQHKPGELSGGQQQRVAIARAIASRPRLILADEPTGNLDSAAGDQVLTLLEGLHAQGCTLVLITHDERVARRAQRRVVLENGCVRDESPSPFIMP